jgi:hypothetical protein
MAKTAYLDRWRLPGDPRFVVRLSGAVAVSVGTARSSHCARRAWDEFVRATEAKWKALAPAIDPHFYPVEILQHLFESLPSADVRITSYNQSARQISVDGEANTAALAYEFIDKIKKEPGVANVSI